MPRNRPILQDHHILEQRTFYNNDLLQALVEVDLIDKDAFENRIYMPADRELAQALGISPHSGGPIGDYQDGIGLQLERLAATPEGRAALGGDPEALERVAARVNDLRDTMKVGLVNGDLYTNAPFGMSADDIRPRTQSFFHGSESYSQTHAHQLGVLNSLSPVDHGYLAVAHSESRIVTLLQFSQQSGNSLTKGYDIELQRHGLAQAIANAHQDGRVVMSEQGIRSVENTLGEEAASRLRVPRGQQGFVSMGLLLGDASASTLVRSGGLLASGADAVITTRRAAELLEQGNATAAQSEVTHALARNAGGWLGGTATAYLVGTSSFAPAALVAADALLMSKAFEKGADLLDNRAIYHQVDKVGVEWQFSGRNWQRQASMDRTPDGVDNPTTNAVGASYEKARELGAYASRTAVEQALGKAPAPQDPFNIPARPGDQHALDNQNWHRDPQTEQWQRQVKTGLTGANDQGVYATQVATPERARELNQEALTRIESNIAQGQEAIAAAYLESFAAQRSQDFIAVPAAVESAKATTNSVRGSDNQLYHRDDTGQWASADQVANVNLALELELTRQIRQPSLERSEQALAEIQARPAPTQAQVEQNELLHRYQTVGTQLNPEWQQAIELATSRTREAHGITGATLQELGRGDTGTLGADSPIIHYQAGPDGVAHQVATTSTGELQQAWNEIRAQRQDQAPLPDSPELRITALSPQERDAYQQALQEANRLGVSALQAQQVAASTVAEARGEHVEERMAPQALIDAHSENLAPRAPSVPVPVEAHQIPTTAALIASQSPEPAREAPRSEPAGSSAPKAVDDSAQPEARAAAPLHAPHAPPPPSQSSPVGAAMHSPAQPVESQPPAPHLGRPDNTQHPATGDSIHENFLARDRAADAAPGDANLPEPEQRQEPVKPAVVAPNSTAGTGQGVAPEVGQDERLPAPPSAPGQDTQPSNDTLGRVETASPTASKTPDHIDHAEHGQVHEREVFSEPARAPSPTEPDHPDHALYQQVRAGVAALDAKHGRDFDATSERMTASLLVLAKGNGLDRVDRVLLSNATTEKEAAHYVFVVQGEPSNPAHQRGVMLTEQAAQTPVEESLQQFNVMSQEQQQRIQAQQLEQQSHGEREQQAVQGRAHSMG